MTDRERGPVSQIGRYQVLRLLGRGAMGEVLLAHDPVLERHVAIKYLRRDLNILSEQRESLLGRLWQEARASARVSHPNIVALHDMGEDPSLGPYLVFEYLDGPTLKARLSEGPLDPKAAARLALALGDALSTAHQAGVLHRDIKPENVILSRAGTKIADFGIARLPNSTLTHGGALLGTPAYSAPETLQGSKFSPASDQFSLAATLYEAVSGRRAFPGDDALQVANRVRSDEPERVARGGLLRGAVDAVLARGLAKNPRSRFADCAEFGSALAGALDDGLSSGLNPHSERPRVTGGSQPDATTSLSAPITLAPTRSPWFLSRTALIVAAILTIAGCFVLSGAFDTGGGAAHAGAMAESPRTSFIQEKGDHPDKAIKPIPPAPSVSTALLSKPNAAQSRAIQDRLDPRLHGAPSSRHSQHDAGSTP